MLMQSENYSAEYMSGLFFITCKASGRETATGLRNERGQCITRGQFDSSAKSAGFDRACKTFMKLGVEV